MKLLTFIARTFVGVLFIISGFIKLNDPIGFSYKLQEYFSSEVLNLPFLEPYALALAIFVVVFEVVLGVFLLIGYQPKFTLWSLLSMIVFFTFLTFYSAYFDKVKDCGCFGDALKLTPWESFTKDLVLLVLILLIFYGQKYIQPIFKPTLNNVIAGGSLVLSLIFGYHVLMHLPSIDFRAYKIGDNLIENMQIPPNAPKAIQEFKWTFDVNGKKQTIITDGAYPDVDGTYVEVETKVVKEGFQPSILDFSIETDSEDFTQMFLAEYNLLMLVSYNLDIADATGLKKLKALSDKAIYMGYTVIGLTASGTQTKKEIQSIYDFNFEFYLCDEKALKTVIRSNPGVLQLSRGTVLQKVHWNDIENLAL